jgi:high frequency lysogenization protein
VTNRTVENRAIALAGLFQAAGQVTRVGWQGRGDQATIATSLASLFTLEAETVGGAYGSVEQLQPGLELLSAQLARPRDQELARYVVSLLHHGRRFLKRPNLVAGLREGIGRAAARLDHFPVDHPNIVAGLAEIYTDTISPISPRILVKGEPEHLQRQEVADLVRALLLAGIRSSVLWQQCGGSRISLIVGRTSIVAAANRILSGFD